MWAARGGGAHEGRERRVLGHRLGKHSAGVVCEAVTREVDFQQPAVLALQISAHELEGAKVLAAGAQVGVGEL